MRYRLLDILICPYCRRSLQLQVLREEKNTDTNRIFGIRCAHFCSFNNIWLQESPLAGYDAIDCTKCYSVEIVEGLLVCQCGAIFPIIDAVPRMLPEAIAQHESFVKRYKARTVEVHGERGFSRESSRRILREDLANVQRSFSWEWKMYQYSELTWESHIEERKEYFLHYLQCKSDFLKGKLILDAGCGNGTLTAAISEFGLEVIGMDLSSSVERAERNKNAFAPDACKPFVHFIQGTVTSPPFRKNSFDIVYSDGVLHHTPDTKKAFMSLAPLVRAGGKYFVWLYKKDLYPTAKIRLSVIHALQRITRKVTPKVLYYGCLGGAAVLMLGLRIQHLLGNRKRRVIPVALKAVNLFDTFSPQFDHCHTFDEVADWFAQAGFSNITDVTVNQVSKWGFGILGISREKDIENRGM